MSFLQSYQTHPQQYTFQPQPQPQPIMQQPLIQQPQFVAQPQSQLQPQPMLQTYQPDPALWQPQPPQSQGPTTHPSRTWGGRGPMLRPRGANGTGRGGRGGGRGGRTPAMGHAAPLPVSQQNMAPVQQQAGGYQQSMVQQPLVQQQFQQPPQSQQYQPQPFQVQQPQPQYQQAQQQPLQQVVYQQQPIQFQPQQQPIQQAQQQQQQQQTQQNQPVQQYVQQQQQQPVQYQTFQQPAQTQQQQSYSSVQQLPQQSMQQPHNPQRFIQQPQQAPQVQHFATPAPVQVRPQPTLAVTQQYYRPQPQQVRSAPQPTFLASTPAPAPAVQPIAPMWQARQPSGSPEPPLPGTAQVTAAPLQVEQKPMTKVILPGLDPARQRFSAGPVQAPAPEPEPEPEPEPLNIDWLNPGEEGDPLTSAPTLIEHPARVWNGLLHALDRSIQPIIRWTYELGEGPDPLTTAHLTLILPPTHPALRSHEKFSTLPASRYDVAYEPALELMGGVKQWTGQPRLLKLDAQNTVITLAISQNALGWIENPFHRLPTPRETPQLPKSQPQVLQPANQETAGQPETVSFAQDAAFVNSQSQSGQWQSQTQHAQPQAQQQTERAPAPVQPASQPSSALVSAPLAAATTPPLPSLPQQSASTPAPSVDDLVRIEWGGGPANGGGEAWVPAASLGGLQVQTAEHHNSATQTTMGSSQALDTSAPSSPPAPSSQGSSTSTLVSFPVSQTNSAPQSNGHPLSAHAPAPLSPVSAAVRAMAERTNVDLIESTCISMGRGGIDADWKETKNEATGLHGCELNINICPSVTRYFATANKHATPELAKEDCATVAIRKEALDFISKYAKYAAPKPKAVEQQSVAEQPVPKTPPLVFSGGRFTAPPRTDAARPAQPQPAQPARAASVAVPVVDPSPKLPAAPPGQTHLDLLLEALRVSVDPSVQGEALNFDPIIETNGTHGCKLLVSVREQENCYMEEAIWTSMDEAREAVCARALELNVQGWMAWAESTFVQVVPAAQSQPMVTPPAATPVDACTAIYTELAHHSLVPEVKYEKDQFSKLYQAQLVVPLPGRNGVIFSVTSQYSHKAEARDAVSQLAVQRGILESIRTGAPLQQPSAPPQQHVQQASSDSDNTASSPSSPLEITELDLLPLPEPSGKRKGKRKGKKQDGGLSGARATADDGWGKKRKSSDAEWVNKLTAVCFQQDLPAPSFETIPAAVLDELDEPLFRVAVTVGLQRFFAPSSEPLPEIEAAKEEICRKAYEQLTRSKRQRQ